jgi:DNA-binding response OmpR family regulator
MKELDGASVLLLEDEYLIALDAEMILKDLGAMTVHIASNLIDAQKYANEQRFDLALLDVNINGHTSFELAQSLRDKGVRVVFASGYDLNRTRPVGDAAIYVGKPYTGERLRDALVAAMQTAATPSE